MHLVVAAVIVVAGLILTSCTSAEGVLAFYDQATRPAGTCVEMRAEQVRISERIAGWSTAGQARDYGVVGGTSAIALGAVPAGAGVLALSAGLTVAQNVDVDLSPDRERLRFLAYERRRLCWDADPEYQQ